MAGEEPEATARREFAEELGSAPSGALHPLGNIRQRGGKQVEAFALEGDFDVDGLAGNSFEIEWPPRSGRLRILSRSRPRGMVRAAGGAPQDSCRPATAARPARGIPGCRRAWLRRKRGLTDCHCSSKLYRNGGHECGRRSCLLSWTWSRRAPSAFRASSRSSSTIRRARAAILQPPEGRGAVAALPVDVGVRECPVRSDLRDRGEFRRTAGPFLGPDGSGVRRSSFGRCCAAASVPRMATDRPTTPSPSPFRAIRSLLTSRRGRCAPASSIRATAASSGIAILHEGELFLATRDALAQSSPTATQSLSRHHRPEQIHRKLRAAAASAAFPGWRNRRRREFPGPNG